MSFVMLYSLIDFAAFVLKLLIFSICGIIGILKINFFNFSSTERVKENFKIIKAIQNFFILKVNHF